MLIANSLIPLEQLLHLLHNRHLRQPNAEKVIHQPKLEALSTRGAD
jgi:hypothetical protein